MPSRRATRTGAWRWKVEPGQGRATRTGTCNTDRGVALGGRVGGMHAVETCNTDRGVALGGGTGTGTCRERCGMERDAQASGQTGTETC
eukprot:192040-Chlamydomonas_euryale.AAC.1